MSKLSGQQSTKAFDFCADRDGGAFCQKAKTDGDRCTKELVLDHKDNNSSHNPPDGSNWQILCRGHNHRKNPRGKIRFDGMAKLKHLRERGGEQERLEEFEARPARPQHAEMKKNIDCEPVFRRTVAHLVDKHGEVEQKTLINAASEKAGVSQQTGTRYLEKLTSILGDFKAFKKEEKTYIRRKEAKNG